MNKTISVIAFAALFLSACSAGTPGMSVGVGIGSSIGSHVGLGTSLNIPISFDKKQPSTQSTSGLKVIEEQIVTYFDAQGQTSSSAVSGGFYRQLISKRNNEYVVQDFYHDNAVKRTDPYTLTRDKLMTFKTHPADGTLAVYAYNGNLMQQQVYRNGKLISANY
ncbi:MAG: NemA protein [Neisseria sp.]